MSILESSILARESKYYFSKLKCLTNTIMLLVMLNVFHTSKIENVIKYIRCDLLKKFKIISNMFSKKKRWKKK